MHATLSARWPWIEGTHTLRLSLLDGLSDEDLAYTPGGENPTLGALCVEDGEVERSYIDSFSTFTQDFSYRADDPTLATSVAKLRAWYQQLDTELQTVLSGLSDEDVTKTVDRQGYPMPVETQADVYLQALLIFLGKVSVYFKAMGKPLPTQVQEWIG